MDWPRRLGVFLVAMGAVLLGVYLVPTLYGAAMAHLAVAEFRAQSSANSLWDSARIRAYQRTLQLAFPAPEAILRIPKVGLEVPVFEGDSDLTLNRGAGHIPGTALPGESGNAAITAHRDGFFRALKDVAPGDIIDVELPEADHTASVPRVDRYVIRDIKVVLPSDTTVLNNTPGSTLTLITCYPFYFIGAAPRRFIVEATPLAAVHGPTHAVQPL